MSAVDTPRDSPPRPERSPGSPTRPAWRAKLGTFTRRAWIMELGVYQSIYRFVFRRPRVPAGARDRIEAMRLWTDDLDGFLSAVRTHIP
ncbi:MULTISPECIES: hypothetical protein [Microbacterium]|uniref:Uncharacterized protein n=1 Tax=Microbacterium trichothecenolyticum TaxID=69370 RepID=A0A0M2H781_MICTR|nr:MULTISPECIES: hypothetical protein [Microbacterium]KJL39794.1 hypothetical protein RS82_04003 [Microbacterium trichothecenolyticum]MDR7189908.1 hypothetical protein [Microbacterium sp. BE35]